MKPKPKGFLVDNSTLKVSQKQLKRRASLDVIPARGRPAFDLIGGREGVWDVLNICNPTVLNTLVEKDGVRQKGKQVLYSQRTTTKAISSLPILKESTYVKKNSQGYQSKSKLANKSTDVYINLRKLSIDLNDKNKPQQNFFSFNKNTGDKTQLLSPTSFDMNGQQYCFTETTQCFQSSPLAHQHTKLFKRGKVALPSLTRIKPMEPQKALERIAARHYFNQNKISQIIRKEVDVYKMRAESIIDEFKTTFNI